ncbi:hypothetical protein FVEG_15670 [Fusarium verticillioides 7600]|uniref:Uncharacterized protein n=1 Tax=Gibberella moniliformis (strain M3125 / FGSC 7600) TaxID=334819 RepID=W7MAM8_GIBM7|nr:hypothetical protein FVEG_15670 [Fusarium verticillioides 7600]EWG44534.1 hypothetical protein FVEG_15670 [Fusarium verticillioides 7600]
MLSRFMKGSPLHKLPTCTRHMLWVKVSLAPTSTYTTTIPRVSLRNGHPDKISWLHVVLDHDHSLVEAVTPPLTYVSNPPATRTHLTISHLPIPKHPPLIS